MNSTNIVLVKSASINGKILNKIDENYLKLSLNEFLCECFTIEIMNKIGQHLKVYLINIDPYSRN